MSEDSPIFPLGEVLVYKAPDGEVRAKYMERFPKDRGHEIRP